MNIFEEYLNKILNKIKLASEEKLILLPDSLSGINVDIPPKKFKCDLSTNVAMVLSKTNNEPPIKIAEKLKDIIFKDDNNIEKIEIAKPGFINIILKKEFWTSFLLNINNLSNFGAALNGSKKKHLIEFVSANPTGPLHVGHCRGAILGDVISNLLKFNNQEVVKEYYVNDHGNQILHFTRSVYLRIKEKLDNQTFPVDEDDLYPGEYIKDIAQHIIDNNKDLQFDDYEKIKLTLTKLAITESLKLIKTNLNNLGIIHDNFASETEIVENKEVDKVIEKLKKDKFVYIGKIKAPEGEDTTNWVERDQLLFRSTDFGDDKDRALQKSDNTWTYFAGDVAYHNTKLNRNFDKLINILGADHAGYIKRITSVVEALSGEKNKLICKVSQLVKLIKDGKPFKMSKRKGDYITVEDLISEVGKDATRFIMLSRSNDAELDFDFTKVKEKSKDNPLYYVQYCYARISSVFRNINKNIDDKIDNENNNMQFNNEEIEIFKKISEWPKCVEISTKKLEPHRIPVYLYELSSQFHSYWNMGKDDVEKRFINDDKTINIEKLIFLKSIAKTIKTGMDIIGVDTPEKM